MNTKNENISLPYSNTLVRKRLVYVFRFVCVLFIHIFSIQAQTSKREWKLDSLLSVNVSDIRVDSLRADHFERIASSFSSSPDYLRAIEYRTKAIELNTHANDKIRLMRLWSAMGVDYTALANYPKALEYYLKSLLISEQLQNTGAIDNNLNNIGRMYMFLGDYSKALEYYQRALSISKEAGFKLSIAKQLRNIGNTYNKMQDYSKALEYLKQSHEMFVSLGYKEGESISLGVIGSVYLNLGQYQQSLETLQKALSMNRQSGNKRQESMNLISIGKLYRETPDNVLVQMGVATTNRYAKALEYLTAAQLTAKQIKDAGTEKTAWLDLSETYEKQGNFQSAYAAYKQFIKLRDSIEGTEIKNTMAIKEMQFEFEKRESKLLFEQQLTSEKLCRQELLTHQQRLDLGLKQQQLLSSRQEKNMQHLIFLKTQAELQQQKVVAENQQVLTAKKDAELQLLNKEKTLQKTQLELTSNELKAKENQRNGFIIGTILLIFFAGAVVMGLKRTSAEKKKSEALLLNILPTEVAMELKQTGESVAKQYNHVTVLFTDFVNFTGISEQLSPTELVAEVHKNFTAFDAIIEQNGLEKIKTIGDAYLAVCGLPNETPDHAQRVITAALQIQSYMNTSENKFQIRIGINSGPVIAGIVGVKKYAYDIWGDTVNTASRMESCSEAGKINISGTTYDLVKDDFTCEYRGKIKAKNKGEIDMYFVVS